MSNLKTLKIRIKSVKSTQKMTKAMKMVAASRLKKSKNLVEISRPYAQKIDEVASGIANNISMKDCFNAKFPLLAGTGKDKTHLLLVISSDRGLCGGLNSSIVKLTKQTVEKLTAQGKEVKIFCVGKKAYEQLRVSYDNKIIDKSFGIFKDIVSYESAENIVSNITKRYESGEFDVCHIFYSKFKSAIAQEQVKEQIIPISLKSKDQKKTTSASPMNYEPGEEEILDELLPKNLTVQIYQTLLENAASEQGARMAAMEAATSNASKMIKDLTLVYNRTRQANITRELIDIVSGANAV